MTGRTRVKICGITRAEDARCAVEAGVDALGFIFFAKSPRNVEPEAARSIISRLPPFVDPVGVFVDEKVERVAEMVLACGLAWVQLHGGESAAYCRQLSEMANCRILKALRVGPHSTAEDALPYRDCVNGYLLDTFQAAAAGGTGQVFDWTLIGRLQLARPFLLAGGLTVANIGPALNKVRPYGVDANSGLEDAPGKKNQQLIQDFISAVRHADFRR